MATSTEETVRDVFVQTIQSIAQSHLDFDEESGNVRDYPLKWHHEEDPDGYLIAKSGGVRKVRCIAVDVLAQDNLYALGQTPERLYAVQILFYYEKGANG